MINDFRILKDHAYDQKSLYKEKKKVNFNVMLSKKTTLALRFADFIEGSPHLLSNEVSVHTQEYGLGGSFFEDELFSTDEEEQEEEEEGWETDDGVKPEAPSPRLNNTRVK